jgi:hypothetical protein
MIEAIFKKIFMRTIVLSLLFLSLISCKSNKETATVGATTPNANVTTENADTKPPQEQSPSTVQNIPMNQEVKTGIETYRLVISLISIGAGTDQEAKHDIDQFIFDYQTKFGIRVGYANQAWGREGESDMMFTLNELTAEKQGEFIKGMREKLKGRELIQIEENKKNRFNR